MTVRKKMCSLNINQILILSTSGCSTTMTRRRIGDAAGRTHNMQRNDGPRSVETSVSSRLFQASIYDQIYLKEIKSMR